MHLTEPYPITSDSTPPHEPWPTEREERLPRDFRIPRADVFELLDSRRTVREFLAVGQCDLSALLWASQRTISVAGTRNRTHSPLPSAGGLAAVRTLVVNEGRQPWIYLPRPHSAGLLRTGPIEGERILVEARDFLDVDGGCLFLFVADRGLMESHYTNPESLVLRESGVLQGCLSLISAPLGLNFCSLGTLATDWAVRLLGAGEEVVIPCGAAMVGRRQTTAAI